MHDDVRTRGRRHRHPAGLVAGPAYAAPLVVCVLAGPASSPSRLAAEVGVLALVVAVVGFESTPAAGMVAIGSSLLSLNGFGLHELGELGWQPSVDLRVAALLLCAWALAWSAREGVPVPGRSSHRVPAAAGAAYPREERHDGRRLHRADDRPVRVAGVGAARTGATVNRERSRS